MKNILIMVGISAIVIGMISFKHYTEINSLKKEHEKEMEIVVLKYKSMIKSLEDEYVKLEGVYNKREEANEEYKDRQKELLEDIQKLEEFIKDNSNNTTIIIEQLDESMNSYMGRVYEETNTNPTIK